MEKQKQSKIWIISDTHFGHEALVRRSWRPEGFDSEIIENWNKLVDDNDIVFHLGDFAIGKYDEKASITENIKLYRKMLKGRIVLIKGNHDVNTNEWYIKNGFDMCMDSMTFWYKGMKILFTHIPKQRKGNWTLNIHGHLHGNNHRPLYQSMYFLFDASVDNLNWQPILLDTLLEQHMKKPEVRAFIYGNDYGK